MLHCHHYNFQFNSKECNENSIFVALETGQRSGMEFVGDALKNGAKIVISQKPIKGMNTIFFEEVQSLTQNANVVVENSLAFVQNLACRKFISLKEKGVTTIGITGSVGKTTTKELIASTLAKRGKTYATQGNYNNHIGLPFTILNAPEDISFLVLEMGMNHEGEICFLTGIAPCDWNIITTVAENHSGNFHNGIDGVLRAKFEIMHSGGKCLVSKEVYERFLNDDTLPKTHNQENIICVDANPIIKIQNDATEFTFKKKSFTLDGIYSQAQAQMFCIAIELMNNVLGIEIEEITLPKIKGRGNVTTWNNIKIVNESYNASPSSMKNALENFRKYNGKKLCILGEMRELGMQSMQYHKELMPHLHGFNSLILVGSEMKNIKIDGAKHFKNYTQCLHFLQNNIAFVKGFDFILVKASNGVNLWKLFDDFFV